MLNKIGLGMLPASDFYCPQELLAGRVASVDYDGGKVYQESLKSQIDDEFIASHCPNIVNGLNVLEEFLEKL